MEGWTLFWSESKTFKHEDRKTTHYPTIDGYSQTNGYFF